MNKLVWNNSNIKRFWDFHSQNNQQEFFTYQYGSSIAELVNIKAKDKVLDYGCGSGELIKHLTLGSNNVYGMDFAPETVNAVNDRYKNNSSFRSCFTYDQILENPLTYDIIFVIEVIEHLTDDYLDELFINLKKLTHPKSKIIITTPNDENLRLNTVYCPECDHTFHRWQHVRNWSQDSLSDYVTSKGLSNFITYTLNFSIKNKNFFKKIINKLLLVLKMRKNPHLAIIINI